MLHVQSLIKSKVIRSVGFRRVNPNFSRNLISKRNFCNTPPKGWEDFSKSSSGKKETEKEVEELKKKLSEKLSDNNNNNENNKDEKNKNNDKNNEKKNDWFNTGNNDKKNNKDKEEDNSDSGDINIPSLRNIFLVLAGGILFVIWYTKETAEETTYLHFLNNMLMAGMVDHLEVINEHKVRVFLKGKDTKVASYYFTIVSIKAFEQQWAETLIRLGVPEDYAPVRYRSEVEYGKELLRSVPTILTIGLLGFFLYAVYKRARTMTQGGPGGIFSSGKSNAKLMNKTKIKVTFKDVAGCEEAKTEIMEFVNFLKNPGQYTALGAKIPKGALLVGPPGTGKTLLAKATAGEASVPFYSVSGSDFIEMFGGVGPARVRDLFAQARRNAPCIIFMDEIDAIGRERGGSNRNDERDNTLNQLLVEMDGFESNKGIVVLAGTNRPDILDKALMRPGRFDRQISIDLPDIKSREAVFKVHLANLKLDSANTIDEYATRLSSLTPGFSGADIANVCNEAALIAARDDKSFVSMNDFDRAIDRVIAGLEKKSRVLSPQEKEIVAYHEAGHALVGWLLPNTDPILKVSIIPRGQAALGFAQQMPVERYLHSLEYIKDRICVFLGGRVAEEIQFGEISTGAQDDLEKITDMAYSTIVQYGMNPTFGNISYSERNSQGYWGKPYSNKTAELVDKEVKKLIDQCYIATKELINNNKDKLEEIAQLLLKKEVIHNSDVQSILGPKVENKDDHQQHRNVENINNAESTGNTDNPTTPVSDKTISQ
eukprot:TRINITY_DN281_c0_g1_i1.p1 TRINITY_DN281_c0_g1~~TRINITY_DN281_c0_g1_i1.p1  ORF type:complete len:769 (-),score=235.00 TRINITY_DN281_c0_g1_i1:1688-3994(-)